MFKHRNNKGFTLIEIIIVVVILSVLMAVSVPTILNYLKETDKVHALNEAHSCVTAANYLSVKTYKTDRTVFDIKSEDILKQSKAKGYISSFLYKDYDLTRLVYHSPNEMIVIFQNKEYKILEPGDIDPGSVEGMIVDLGIIEYEKNLSQYENTNTSNNPDPSKNGRTYYLQKNYLEEHGGKYPSLSLNEIKLLTQRKITEENARKLRWKPLYDNEGHIFLTADSKSEESYDALAPLIYYKGIYYYHKAHFPQNATNSYIQESLFSEQTLGLSWAIAN